MWKSRAIFLTAFLCAVLLARFYSNPDVAVLLFYALALLVLLSLTAALAARFFLRVEQRADAEDLFKNDVLRYEAKLLNRGPFFYARVSLAYHNAALLDCADSAAPLAPWSAVCSGADVRFRCRGIYRLGVKSVTVTDFLGLFRATFPIGRPLTVTVFPTGDEAFSAFMRNDSASSAFRQDLLNESCADMADVRKYTSSDSLRKVHWKLSAKRNELMVKNFQPFEPNRTLLYVDAQELPLDKIASAAFEDKVVSFAAAAVDCCMQSRLSAQLAWSGDPRSLSAIDPAEPPDKIYRVLAGLSFSQEQSEFPQFCKTLAPEGAPYNLLLFLCDIDDAVCDALIQFATHDDNLFVYYFYSKELPLTGLAERYLNSLKTQGILVNRVEAPSGWE